MRDDDLAATAGATAGALWAAAVIAALFGAGGAPVGVMLLLGFVLIGVAAMAAPNTAQLGSVASRGAQGAGRAANTARTAPSARTARRPARPRPVTALEPDGLGAAVALMPTDEFVPVAVETPPPLEPEPRPAAQSPVAESSRVLDAEPSDDPVATFLAAARAWVAGDRAAAAEGFLTVSRLDHPLAERAVAHLEELRAHGVELSADPAGASAASTF